MIGAGISGLLAAGALQSSGARVLVLDKGRGVGGRLATRRTETGVFDHGAQFFTARDPRFRLLVEAWVKNGIVRPWAIGFALSDGTMKMDGETRYCAAAGMTAIAKHLARGLNLQIGAKVTSVRAERGGWLVETEKGDHFSGRALLLTPPVPQSLQLLDTGNVSLPEGTRGELEELEYAPCLAVLAQLSGPSLIPEPGGLWFPGEPIAWMADNHLKGVSPGPGAAVTIHAGPQFSGVHWEKPEAEVTAAMLAVVMPWLGTVPVNTQLHRWRCSLPTRVHAKRCLALLNPAPLVLAGDAFGGPRVEGAALSGLAAGAELAQILAGTSPSIIPATDPRRAGLALGGFIADALSMPVHWYYDRAALLRDYGIVHDYLPPKNPHPGSILWRSEYHPLNQRGDILHEQAQYWGQRGIHYHQFLRAGENTLNLQLARLLIESLNEKGRYDPDDYLQRYIDFMLTPGRHRDTYIEECHRKFFTAYSRGAPPRKCGGSDIHIGGLAHVGVLTAFFGGDPGPTRDAVQQHVQLTHRSPEVLAAADALVRMLCAALDGAGLRDAICEHGSDWLSKRKAEQWLREPDEVVIGQRVSSACYIDDAFPASLYLAWKYAGDFEAGIIANANVGGDNCHRGAVVGALLGAGVAMDGIPSRFRHGLHNAPGLLRQINLLGRVRQ